MHAAELIDLAALVAMHAPMLVRGRHELSEASIEGYWVSSKCRLDRWGRALKALAAQPATGPRTTTPLVRGLLEEVLTGEVLTRLWTAAMCAYDRRRGSDRAEPIVRSVLIGHLEARHRTLTLLVRGPGIDAASAVLVNHVRRRAERWTDMLLAPLAPLCDIAEFAFDPSRAKDFADDLSLQESLSGGQAWALVQAALRAGFRQGLAPVSPSADLNSQIARSVLAAFPAALFDGTGLPQSEWMLRMTSVSEDAQGMLEELLGPTIRPLSPPSPPSRLDGRPRRFRQ